MEHDHEHSHTHSHDHDHDHDSHSHEHEHDHDHGEDHGAGHDHSHDKLHDQGHSHDHGHCHGHSHDHSHGHDHSHTHGGGEMDDKKKLPVLLDHWIKHNEEHRESLVEWSAKARDMGLADVADALDKSAAELGMSVDTLRGAKNLFDN